VVEEAGRLLNRLYREKRDSEADRLSHDLLISGLKRVSSEPVVSEEDPFRPASWNRADLWVIDPLDGTREFLRGVPEFAVSVAHLAAGFPDLGVVLNPMTGELFHAIAGQGASLNRQKIPPIGRRGGAWLVSRTDYEKGLFALDSPSLLPLGSIAYKLARVSVMEQCRGVLSLTPKSLWDVLAGMVIARESGFGIYDLEGNPLGEEIGGIKIPNLIAVRPEEREEALRTVKISFTKSGGCV